MNTLTSGLFFIAAITLLAGCSGIAPPPTAWQTGQKQLEAGQLSEARRSFERELHEHPDNQKARYNLALLLTEAGHAQDAARLYQENLDLGWHFPSAINLALYWQAQGKSDAALALLTRATQKSPHEATPWYLLAAIAEIQDKPELAERHYRKALQADPANGHAHLRYAVFQSQHQRDDGGIAEGNKAMKLLPACAPCWRQYGDILMTAGKFDQARAAYQRSLAIRPSAGTRQRLIDLLRQTGQQKQAARMQRALDAWRQLADDSKD
ncbi:MAG: tetratricopeptide repeat protein [Mariprofundaceae bacterium]